MYERMITEVRQVKFQYFGKKSISNVLWDLVRKTILNGGWSVVPIVDTPIIFEKPNEGLQYLQSQK